MLINIDQIKITDRIRKSFGDIEELANDIHINKFLKPKLEGINTCIYCGNPFVDAHHLIPKELFGKDESENIMYICANHHRILHFLVDLDNKDDSERIDKLNDIKFKDIFQKLKYIMVYEKNIYDSYNSIIKPAIQQHLNTLLKEIENGNN